MNPSTKRRQLTVVVVAGLFALAAGVLISQAALRKLETPPDIPGLLWPDPKSLTPFEVLDQHRNAFDLTRMRGRWTFMFFGFTNCPDVCPTTLAVLDNVKGLLASSGSAMENVQFVFVTVDPERDTPELLADYLGFFDPEFLGVSAPDDALAGLTKQLGILYHRGEPDENGNYPVDHTASILLIGPETRLVALFGAPHDPKIVADRFRRIREFVGG